MASRRNIRAGRAAVEVWLDDTRMVRGLRRAQARLRAFSQNVRALGQGMLRIGATVTGPLLAAARVFSTMGDDLDTLSQKTGVSVESLSQLKFAAEESSIAFDSVAGAIQRMNRRLGRMTAGQGSQTEVDAVEQLGLSIEHLERMNPEQRFLAIADAMAQHEDRAEAAGLAQRAFGTEVDKILPLLLQGADGIRNLMQEADDLGRTISTEAAENAARFGAVMRRLWGQLRMVTFEIGGALAPALEVIATKLREWAQVGQELIKRNRQLVVLLLAAGTAVVSLGLGLVLLGAFGTLAAAGLGFVTTAAVKLLATLALIAKGLFALISPIGLVVAAAAVIGVVFVRASGMAGAAIDWLSDRFSRLGDFVRRVTGGIRDALIAGDIQLAARVLWLGLEVAFRRGIQPLREMWERFRTGFMALATEAFFGVRTAWAQFRGWMERNFPQLTANMAETWAKFAASVRTIWARTQTWIADQWLDLTGRIQGLSEEEIRGAQQLNQQDLNRRLNEINRAEAEAIAEAERRAGRTANEVDRELAEELERLAKARDERLAAHATGEDARIAEAEKNLQEALNKLDEAIQTAKQRRDETERDRPPGGTIEDFEQWLQDLLNGLNSAVRQTEVRGTFQAAGVRGLGVGTATLDRIAKASEETADSTNRTEKNTRNSNTYGP